MFGFLKNKNEPNKETNQEFTEIKHKPKSDEKSQSITESHSDTQAHSNPPPVTLKTWEITKHIATELKDKVMVGAETVFEKTKDIILGPEESHEEIPKSKTHGIIKDDYNKRIIE